jgi:iron complex transport system substrate-binding protein
MKDEERRMKKITGNSNSLKPLDLSVGLGFILHPLHFILQRQVYRAIGLFLLSTLAVFIVSACSDRVHKNSATTLDVSSRTAYRTVKHTLGEVRVPLHPQRIAALGNVPLEAALALGFKPVGVATWGGHGTVSGPPPYIKGEGIEDIENIGQEGQPNLEKLLALKPDLILGESYYDKIYNQLQQIAPTVLHEWTPTWKSLFRSYAEALGKTTEVENIVNDYDRRIAQFKQQMGDRLKRTTVSVIQFEPGQVRLYMHDSYNGRILQDLGLPRPRSQDKDKWTELISIERIPDADGDVIFVAQADREATLYRQFASNPMWQQLRAVKSGRVYEADFDYWMGGGGPISINLVLDDLFRYLVEGRQGTT